ncbi:MAG: hypothetical protein G01um101431_497 [Parcubacteria group bacterium Gr01-1014_31]|nr:MAG: hypothetical protein G01um101431_497 [Parcubacteria group bacterium Gr01-1014_31]
MENVPVPIPPMPMLPGRFAKSLPFILGLMPGVVSSIVGYLGMRQPDAEIGAAYYAFFFYLVSPFVLVVGGAVLLAVLKVQKKHLGIGTGLLVGGIVNLVSALFISL